METQQTVNSLGFVNQVSWLAGGEGEKGRGEKERGEKGRGEKGRGREGKGVSNTCLPPVGLH